MAYSTGTINAATDFPAILDSFLLANGWTKTNNSVNINLTSSSFSPTSISTIQGATNFASAIPAGAKVTWGAISSQKVYTINRSLAAALDIITDASFTGGGATTANCSWSTYNKGTKYINFAAGISNIPNPGTNAATLQYIIFDVYHQAIGNHNLIGNYGQVIRFDPAFSELPATYEIFLNSNPDMVSCIFTYGGGRCKHVHFGDLVKVHNSAFVGGEFLSSSDCFSTGSSYVLGSSLAEASLLLGSSAHKAGGFFASTAASFRSSIIHAEIDSILYSTENNQAINIGISENTCRRLFRGLNQWNQQITLVTPELIYNALAGFKMYLGYIEHVRLCRNDNYNTGDTITIGSDIWKIYPMAAKNTSIRDGNTIGTGLSGTIAFAVRKT